MGPIELVIQTQTVEYPGGTFAVRGFSPNDALTLYLRHAGELSKLFDQFANQAKVEGADAVTAASTLEAASSMVAGTPLLMAEILAVAMDADPADIEGFTKIVSSVLKLPIGVQMDALNKIADMTFTSDMPLGKFLTLVLSMAQSATAALSAPKA